MKRGGRKVPRGKDLLRILRSKRELARLNHIFIPAKKTDRDKFRKSFIGRSITPIFGAYGSLSREGRVLFLVTMMIGLAGLDVIQTQVHLLFAMLCGLVVASLAARPFFRARGLTLQVDAPPRVSVGEVQRFVVTLSNAGPKQLVSLQVAPPFLPWDGEWVKPPEAVSVVKSTSAARTTAEARFLARGEHHLDSFEVGMLLPFGLAIGPRRLSNGPKFLVVPRIAPVSRLTVQHVMPRARDARILSHAPGESEFAGVRPYRPGDAPKHLHARTWARTGIPHVKSFVAERSERTAVALLLDDELGGELEKEAALSLAAGVIAHLSQSGSAVSTLAIDLEHFRIEPRSGRAALDAALDRLSVHNLTTAVEPVEEGLIEMAGGLSSLVLITADEGERRRSVVSQLTSLGLPVRWFRVVATEEEASSGETSSNGPMRISRASIDGEGVLSL